MFKNIEYNLAIEYEKLELEFIKKESAMLNYQQIQNFKSDVANRNKGKYKKHYIIRESDVKKIPADVRKRYTVSFKPLTKEYFERRSTFFYLKNRKYLGDQYALNAYPKDMLARLTNIPVFSADYLNWLICYNDAGEMTIRAGIRQPESRLGLAIFREK
jgi:hypothetical protein